MRGILINSSIAPTASVNLIAVHADPSIYVNSLRPNPKVEQRLNLLQTARGQRRGGKSSTDILALAVVVTVTVTVAVVVAETVAETVALSLPLTLTLSITITLTL